MKYFKIKDVLPTSVTLAWGTSEVTRFKFEYNTDKTKVTPRQNNNLMLSPDPKTDHVKVVNNLTPNTTYYFELITFDNAGNSNTTGLKSFKTLEKPKIINTPDSETKKEDHSKKGEASVSVDLPTTPKKEPFFKRVGMFFRSLFGTIK